MPPTRESPSDRGGIIVRGAASAAIPAQLRHSPLLILGLLEARVYIDALRRQRVRHSAGQTRADRRARTSTVLRARERTLMVQRIIPVVRGRHRALRLQRRNERDPGRSSIRRLPRHGRRDRSWVCWCVGEGRKETNRRLMEIL